MTLVSFVRASLVEAKFLFLFVLHESNCWQIDITNSSAKIALNPEKFVRASSFSFFSLNSWIKFLSYVNIFSRNKANGIPLI